VTDEAIYVIFASGTCALGIFSVKHVHSSTRCHQMFNRVAAEKHIVQVRCTVGDVPVSPFWWCLKFGTCYGRDNATQHDHTAR
jgi:hypothetical protein